MKVRNCKYKLVPKEDESGDFDAFYFAKSDDWQTEIQSMWNDAALTSEMSKCIDADCSVLLMAIIHR